MLNREMKFSIIDSMIVNITLIPWFYQDIDMVIFWKIYIKEID